MYQNFFDIYADLENDDFIKVKMVEWYFALTSKQLDQEHFLIGNDCEVFFKSIIYKTQAVVLKNDWKGLILGSNTKKLNSILES